MMPTASGAAGRVAVGVDAHRCTWTAVELKRKTKPPNRVRNSYLERYQELKMRKKNISGSLQEAQDHTDPRNDENDGTKEASTQKKDRRGDQASGKTASEKRSKKSRLCAIL